MVSTTMQGLDMSRNDPHITLRANKNVHHVCYGYIHTVIPKYVVFACIYTFLRHRPMSSTSAVLRLVLIHLYLTFVHC